MSNIIDAGGNFRYNNNTLLLEEEILKLLFVDDDMDILNVNKGFFLKKGYEVFTADNAENAVSLFNSDRYDCIILDICMDNKDGYDLCSYFKSISGTPIIFLTNLLEEEALTKGFSCGADDYLVKPYRLSELDARITARVRGNKQMKSAPRIMMFNDLLLNDTLKQAYAKDTLIGLTQGEFEILWFLASNKGTPYTQESIYRAMWGGNEFYNSHSIQILIMRIRKKLAAALPSQEFIKTRWGKGYFFTDSL